MTPLIIFLAGSVGLVLLSAKSLAHPRSHGFPRFFAFEAILGLVALNVPSWFVKPYSLLQIISWVMLLDASFLAIHSTWVLAHYGKPDKTRQDAERISIEKTTRLVTEGPYHFIRHPMYASLLWLALGVFLKQATLLTTSLTILAGLALYLTAIREEQEDLHTFGDEYLAYMRRTKRLIPFLI